MRMARLFYAQGCRLCDAAMSQLDECGARYNAIEVVESKDKDSWIVVETKEEISITIMKGVPALFDQGVMIVGYQIGMVIAKYKEILMKAKK